MSVVFFALAAAVCFGTALVVTHAGLAYATPLRGVAISITCTLVLCWLFSVVAVDWSGMQAAALLIFGLVGLFYPAIVTMLTYESNRVLGPTLTGAASSTTPVFAVATSVLLLGERPTLAIVLGGLLVVGGLILLSLKGPLEAAPGWRLLLPLSGAALRGGAQSLLKLGLLIWPNPYAAVLVTYTASAGIAWGAAAGKAGGGTRTARAGLLWFAAAGVLNGSAVLLMCYALQHGSVSTVSPVVATYPLFTMLLSALFLRREAFTALNVAGAMLTVAGVTVVATG